MFEEAFCVLRLYLMTHAPPGDGKGVILLSFDSSFRWCEQFCLG